MRKVPGSLSMRSARQLPRSDTRIRQQAQDYLVALQLRHILQPVDVLPAQHVEDPSGKLRHLSWQQDDLPLSPAPSQEEVHVPHVGVHRVPGQRASLPALLEELSREPVQHPLVQLPHLGDLVALAPGQEDLLQRVAIGVAQRLRRVASRPAVCKVVLDQSAQR